MRMDASPHEEEPSDESLIHALVEARPDPFVLIDKRYRIVVSNARYASLYGLQPGQLTGLHCHEVSHHRSTPCHEHGEACPLLTVMESGEPTEVVHVHYGCGHQQNVVRIQGYPVRMHGQLLLGESIQALHSDPSMLFRARSGGMKGASPAFVESLAQLSRAARSQMPVLLMGETGVGKELAARYVHDHSSRADRAFVTVDCATLPEALAEDELFGHVRGAYSGAMGMRPGLFEQANGGTLLLDAISDLAPAVQAKLVRVLETGVLRRLGEGQPRRVDVRIVCCTTRDLLLEVESGRFRPELYYRIAGMKVTLPPLRQRAGDIELLAEHFLDEFQEETGDTVRLLPEAMHWLQRHDFPGNLRELRQLIFRAATEANGSWIDASALQSVCDPPPSREPIPPPQRDVRQRRPSGRPDLQRLTQVLAKHEGRRAETARELGVSERTLYRWLQKHGELTS